MKIRKNTNIILRVVMLLFAASIFYACGEDPTSTLWDKYKDTGNEANPTITYWDVISKGWDAAGVNSAWASIDTIAIHGKNFFNAPNDSTKITQDTTNMWVYFNTTKAKIVDASGDSVIKVVVPSLVANNITLKVVKRTAELIANSSINVKQAIGALTTFGKGEQPTSIVFDKDGNLYTSLLINGVGQGVWKLSIDGTGALTKTQYALKGVETNWSALKFGGSQLYAAKKNKGIWKLNPGLAPTSKPWVVTAGNVNDFDFGPNNGYIYAGGQNIYVIKIADSTQSTVTTSITVAGLRVFGNYVYVGGTKAGVEGIWRFPISGATLGAEEQITTFASSDGKIQAITLDKDGNVYVALDNNNWNNPSPMFKILANGTKTVLFPNSIPAVPRYFTWTTNAGSPDAQYLYYSKDASTTAGVSNDARITIMKVMTFNTSAPYYGLQL